MKINELVAAVSLGPFILGLAILTTAGCENKEKVLEVDTPDRHVEVERDRDTGEIDVDATDEDDRLIDIDTPGTDVEINR